MSESVGVLPAGVRLAEAGLRPTQVPSTSSGGRDTRSGRRAAPDPQSSPARPGCNTGRRGGHTVL